MDPSLSLVYIPTAVALGALHALEPGHAKTLTAAYLIGVKGTRRDAVLLGLSVAVTHSIVVCSLAMAALWLGRETFTENASRWLQLGSGGVVLMLGAWMVWRRWPRATPPAAPHGHAEHAHDHEHGHDHEHEHEHLDADSEAHMCAHAAAMPDYVARGERPSLSQICIFGAAGGLVPCPASVTVMLLALSAGEVGLGVTAVLGFSVGLALALVSVGLLVVAGLSRLSSAGRLGWFSRRAPMISAAMVVLSGLFALLLAH